MKVLICDICEKQIDLYLTHDVNFSSDSIERDLFKVISRWGYKDFHKNCINDCVSSAINALEKAVDAVIEEKRK